MTRHLMEPDPDAEWPSLTEVLWAIAITLAWIVFAVLAVKGLAG